VVQVPKISFTVSEVLYRILESIAKQRNISVHQLAKEISELYVLKRASEDRYQNVDIRMLASERRYQDNDTQVGFRTLTSEHRYQDADINNELSKRLESLESMLDMVVRELRGLQDSVNAYTGKVDQLFQRLSQVAETLEHVAEVLKSSATGGKVPGGNVAATAGSQPAQQKSKRSAWEILEERGVSCVSEMKAERPDAVMGRLLEEGAYAVTWDKDKCAILPEAYEGLLELLPEVKVSDPERVTTLLKARDSRYARVFRVLYKAGVLYYDREKGWQVDEEYVERGGGE
jgi:uncharacterized protein YukE